MMNADTTHDAAARAERHRRNAMSSRLLLLRLRAYHYEHAPEVMKSKWVPSVIVGNPLINRVKRAVEASKPKLYTVPVSIQLEETRTVGAGSIKTIIDTVSKYYRMPIEDILGPERSGKIAMVRQVAMYLGCEHTAHSMAGLGRAFHRDHTTVMHGRNRIRRLMRNDQTLSLQVAIIRQQMFELADYPTEQEIKTAREMPRGIPSQWKRDDEIRLVRAVRRGGQTWDQIGQSLGVSASSAFSKYQRLQEAAAIMQDACE